MVKTQSSERFEKALTELCKILDVKVDRLDFDYEKPANKKSSAF